MTADQQQSFTFLGGGQAILPVRRNLVIEAGAGTGKTTAIVGEVLKLLLGGEDVTPERIVLVTFTEKAAGEIADRIHAALEEIQRQADRNEPIRWPAQSDKPLFKATAARRDACRHAVQQQLARIDALRSQTIHAFCQSILRQFPIEAGIDPQFRIIEGFDRSLLYDEVFDAWVDHETRVRGSVDAAREWEELLQQCNYVFLARGIIFSLLEKRHLLLDDSYDIGSIAEYEQTLIDALRAVPVRAEAPPPRGSSIDAWIDYFAPCAKQLRAINLNKDKRDRKGLAVLRPEPHVCVYDILINHRAAAAALSLTRRFIDYLDREKRARGVVDFDDLLLRTRSVLGNPAVLDRVRNQFDFIFVDEFQDTDRVQADILRAIATDRDGNFVPGRIAIVGDPKQSIYAFRRADPETYASFTKAIRDAGGGLELLTDQYRSTPQLVEEMNRIGPALFNGGDRDPNVFQPEYHTLTAAHTAGGPTPVVFLDGGDDPEKEAEAIVAWIREQNEPDLRKFALLFRRRTRIETYLDVFERRGLGYVVPPLGLSLEEPAAVDLLAVLRAIAYGYDKGALISAARSPYFALTDSEIAEGMLSGEDVAWKQFIASLKLFRDASRHMTVTATIDHVLATTGIDSLYEGDRSLRHLEQVRAIAFSYDQKAGGSLRQFVEEIARRRETPEEVDASLLDDTTNAVRILTIHGAKGLEFDRVILPDVEFTTNSTGVDVFTVEEPRSLVMRNNLRTLSGICRFSDNRALDEIGSLRDKAETRRLFYVAVTRAKSQVAFVVREGLSNKGFGRLINEAFPDRLTVAGFQLPDRDARQPGTGNQELSPCIIPQPQSTIEKLAPADAKIARAGMANRAAGILLHRVLERWDGKSAVAPLIDALAIELASSPRTIDVVRKRIAQVERSATFRRIAAAETAGREMPIAFIDEAGALVERRIDRLIRENGGDIVIDYKSGEPSDFRVARDREQVSLYCRVVAEMTGRPCRGLLWYIDGESDVAVDV